MGLNAARRARPEVRHFADARPARDSRWVFSADFNVDPAEVARSPRIRDEVPDLRKLLEAGAAKVILAHQGRFGKTRSLEFVADFLTEALGQKVAYFPSNATSEAQAFASAMAPGDIALLGNTRDNRGEERGDPALAEVFSRLGPAGVVIGGFGKAHREATSSSVGLLRHLVGYLGTSQLKEKGNGDAPTMV